jgi:hypothetical protein
VTTVAGSSEEGKVDGEGAGASFKNPFVLALDERGRLLVVDLNLGCLRMVEASLAPPQHLVVKLVPPASLALQADLGKLLEDAGLADVTFAVDGQHFPAHRCVLAARSAYFSGMFKSGQGMLEGGNSAAGQDIVLKEVGAGAFRVLLRYLYAGKLPEGEESWEGVGVVEMAGVADQFQAGELYEHCVGQFREELRAANVMGRLVEAHDSGLGVLEEAAMGHFKANALAFQVLCLFVLLLCPGAFARHHWPSLLDAHMNVPTKPIVKCVLTVRWGLCCSSP